MARPTSKTPRQIAEELEAKAKAARVRAMKQEASDSPILAPVQKEMESIGKDIAAHSRKISGPNSFSNRIQSATLRLEWIRAEEALIRAQDANDRRVRDYLQSGTDALLLELANGKEVTEQQVSDLLAGIPYDDNLAALADANNHAQAAWRSFVADTKANDGESTNVATA